MKLGHTQRIARSSKSCLNKISDFKVIQQEPIPSEKLSLKTFDRDVNSFDVQSSKHTCRARLTAL
jgi:hypothetical protein